MHRRARRILGLNSGTSADGVDAALCEITGKGAAMRVRVIGHVHRRYPAALRRRLLAAMAPANTTTGELCRLHADIGEAFARTAAAAMQKLAVKRVDLVGSHGQTICHLPPRRKSRRPKKMLRRGNVGSTLQIGEPARIAAAVGAPVVSQFRQADVAVGGQGAPLVPWTDWVLFRHARRDRALLNLGGIANLTFLPAGGGENAVIAFDTGPGNMVIDGLVRHFTKGKATFDLGGRVAARGNVHGRLLVKMLIDVFSGHGGSLGREQFGDSYLRSLLRRGPRRLPREDWIATATDLTVWSVMLACYNRISLLEERHPPFDELILCGGGMRNRTLVGRLRENLGYADSPADARMTTTDDYSIPFQAKECVSFAMLAAACVDRVPANLPQVTGATRRVVLGQVCEP